MFRLQWTGPSGTQSGTAPTAKAAFLQYVELLGEGHARVEVRNEAGDKLTANDLSQLVVSETRERLSASRS